LKKVKLINQLLLVFSTIVIYEFLRLSKFDNFIKSNIKIYKKINNLFRFKKVSDSRKEKLTFNYSKSLFIISLKILFILIFILAFVIILNLFTNSFLNLFTNSFLNLVISALGIIEITLIFIIYHQLKKRINAKL